MRKYFENMYKDTDENYYVYLRKWLLKDSKKMIITANPETFMMADSDKDIDKMLLDKKNSIIPDGIAIVKSGKMLGYDVKERITGVDVAAKLLELANELHKRVFLFGSKEEVMNKMEQLITDKYHNITLVGTQHGYVDDKDEIFKQIKETNPDIVLVALGIPLQEKLIYKHLKKFKKGIFVGVGGSFDVISGSKKRAPKIFIRLNLEWLYRILKEPSRIKRFYNSNVKFIFKVRKEKKND